MGLDDSKAFSESLRKELFARLTLEIQMASILSTASGPAQTASEGLAISLSPLQLGLRVGKSRDFRSLANSAV